MMNKMENIHPSIKKICKKDLPTQLLELPDAPDKLYILGRLPKDVTYITIVGPRKPSTYGKNVCESIVSGLAGYPIAIISGLALGIDALAHKCALKHGIVTVAVLGSGIDEDVLYPRSNVALAKEIIKKGGALVSEYEPTERAQKYMFPKRNRIMAGLSDVLIIIEAQEKSGTLITAYLGLDYNKTICAVPGSIFSKNSFGTNKLIKEGAVPITCSNDIIDILGFPKEEAHKVQPKNLSEDELIIIKGIGSEYISYDELVESISLSSKILNITLTELEIKGLIKNNNGLIQKI